jgi:hypothetical protein
MHTTAAQATEIAALAEIIRPYLPAAIERFGSLEAAVDALVALMAEDAA